MWARLPANHVFSFVYICVLSFMRGSSAEKDLPCVIVEHESDGPSEQNQIRKDT